MDIGKPKRTYTIEPLKNPVPREQPTPHEAPKPPRPERVPAR